MSNEKKIVLDKNIVALTEEPAGGKTVQDVRLWLSYHESEGDLANALALVSNQVGWLDDEVYDYEEGTAEYSRALDIYTGWRDFYFELTKQALEIIKTRPELAGKISFEERVGTHYQILPFMSYHGYSDKNGWWIKSEERHSI